MINAQVIAELLKHPGGDAIVIRELGEPTRRLAIKEIDIDEDGIIYIDV